MLFYKSVLDYKWSCSFRKKSYERKKDLFIIQWHDLGKGSNLRELLFKNVKMLTATLIHTVLVVEETRKISLTVARC